MVDNQHRKIEGYRELTEEEIHVMNEVKNLASQVGALAERIHNQPGTDQRWSQMALDSIQSGFMFLTRSIAKPTTF